jgi:hypothetical protein
MSAIATTAIDKTAIDRLIAGIEAGAVPDGVFSEDALLDATVPNWRFSVQGGEAVREELSHWYADPGQFKSMQRTAIPGGELLEFTLTWTEKGVDHTCHQAHILRLAGGRVSNDTAFCGGRWPDSLVAEMSRADEERAGT